MDKTIQAAAAAIADSTALLIAAGAGIGVDSGLPDFRGDEGFWRAYPALGRSGMSFRDVASPHTFSEDPALAWGFYGHRLALYRRTRPHAGFGILRRWADQMPRGYGVFTSNVDGHFQRAGFREARIAECHGSIHQLQCMRPCCEAVWPADEFVPEVDEQVCRLLNAPPSCPWCGGMARPNVLMFGDGAWCAQRAEQQEQRLQAWLDSFTRLVVVEIGAGSAIPSVRRFGRLALEGRAGVLIRINPREAEVQRSQDIAIASPGLAALQAIDEVLRGRPGWEDTSPIAP
jgi:NAD-dependent SIR2 family protein deacetylase